MNQIPCVAKPNVCTTIPQNGFQPQAPQQALSPNYNAVKIDIHNPSVGVPQSAPITAPCYNYPQTPLYDYPQAPVYNYPAQDATCQAPVYVPQQPVVVPQVPVQNQPETVVKDVPQPAIINQQNINQPVTETKPAQDVKEAKVDAEKKPEIVPEQQVTPAVDLNAFIAKLTNPDFDAQVNGMEQIADLVQNNPQAATELVDAKIFDALNDIIKADTTNLAGPTAQQTAAREKGSQQQKLTKEEEALALQLSPKEQAERNKSYALFTTAILDKLYADEVQKLNNTEVPLTELPGIVGVVDQLKDNPNPVVRSSAIEALSYLQKPAYKKDLTTLFTVAQNDQHQGVAQQAKAALDKLNQI